MRTRRILVLCVVVAVVLAGCVGLGDDDAEEDAADAEMAADRPDDSEEADIDEVANDGDSTAQIAAEADDRALIRTGTVELSVPSYEDASATITETAAEHDGYVSDSHERLHRSEDGSWTTGTLVIRVPASEFETALESIEAEGTVVDSRTESEDVTEQVIDIEARLATKEAQRDRLTGLYDDAETTEELLELEEQLTEVQTEIERLEAEQRSLEDQVTLATITVELEEPAPSEPDDPVEAWYETGVIAAFLSSVSGVGTAIRALVVGVAYALPYILAFGIPLAGVGYLLTRWRP